ncbi:NUDIX domain-containing protein [Bacillus salinus]|uniref:NUDIX domain-containing protein n=1 Tax=Bacillus sp. HMF5848 TaxID=2495421 RepID=UPI001639A316|nr:NUDIX hydrolase [Bacillus sp. HMF5848]
MSRARACAAILKDNCILMVKEIYNDKTFWTLPGGGLEEGESYEEAVIREVKEEVNLDVEVVRFLFTNTYSEGEEKCFLVRVLHGAEPTLGYDPEAGNNQTLSEVKWHSIDSMENDLHVSKVMLALSLK